MLKRDDAVGQAKDVDAVFVFLAPGRAAISVPDDVLRDTKKGFVITGRDRGACSLREVQEAFPARN